MNNFDYVVIKNNERKDYSADFFGFIFKYIYPASPMIMFFNKKFPNNGFILGGFLAISPLVLAFMLYMAANGGRLKGNFITLLIQMILIALTSMAPSIVEVLLAINLILVYVTGYYYLLTKKHE